MTRPSRPHLMTHSGSLPGYCVAPASGLLIPRRVHDELAALPPSYRRTAGSVSAPDDITESYTDESPTEVEATKRQPGARRRQRPPATLRLFDPRDLMMMREQLGTLTRTSERRTAAEPYIKRMEGMPDGQVPLSPVPQSFGQRLEQLRHDMPNFGGVVDLLGPLLRLQQAGDRSVRLPAILLDGPPGIGKTFFAKRLAEALGLHFVKVSLETATAAWVISGASPTWANGGPGIVFRTLATCGLGNPLVLLDEIDKAGSEQRYNPLNSLYSLLERNSAREFRDEAFPDFPVNASAINWIVTSNRAETIPAPLLSRLRVVKVEAPSRQQRLRIAAAVYRDLRCAEQWGKRFNPSIKLTTLRCLSACEGSPRDLMRIITQACAYALAAKRRGLEPDDVLRASRAPAAEIDLSTVTTVGTA